MVNSLSSKAAFWGVACGRQLEQLGARRGAGGECEQLAVASQYEHRRSPCL